jgi:hypothetical protein
MSLQTICHYLISCELPNAAYHQLVSISQCRRPPLMLHCSQDTADSIKAASLSLTTTRSFLATCIASSLSHHHHSFGYNNGRAVRKTVVQSLPTRPNTPYQTPRAILQALITALSWVPWNAWGRRGANKVWPHSSFVLALLVWLLQPQSPGSTW